MCILFIYNCSMDPESDYAVITISNRDEFYDRPALAMGPFSEDVTVFGGRDLQADRGKGTWFGFSAERKKAGVLLNLPADSKDHAISRGKVVTDYVKNEKPATVYVEDMKSDVKQCNEFIFVSLEFTYPTPTIYSYISSTDELTKASETCLGFGNCLPQNPLKKVESGKQKLQEICSKYKKVTMKQDLIEDLLKLLKSDERHLPDTQLEMSRPNLYRELSSIFVCVPKERYGTRTHTLLLVTKSGHADFIEYTMQEPIDLVNPKWGRSEYQFDIVF